MGDRVTMVILVDGWRSAEDIPAIKAVRAVAGDSNNLLSSPTSLILTVPTLISISLPPLTFPPHTLTPFPLHLPPPHPLSESFVWPFGTKRVVANEGNNGLSGQWFYAWFPGNESELAFVLEDDLEVSPLFYRWSTAAVRLYYTGEQRKAHRQLLLAVRAHVLMNNTNTPPPFTTDEDDDDSGGGGSGGTGGGGSNAENKAPQLTNPLDQFVKEFSGQPIMYGSKFTSLHITSHHITSHHITPLTLTLIS